MFCDSTPDPLWSLEMERRRALQITRVLDAYAESLKSGLPPRARRDRALIWTFESLVLRHHSQKEELVLFPWLEAHHSDFSGQWVREHRLTRCQQAYALQAFRTQRGPSPSRRPPTLVDTVTELARLQRGLLETYELEILPILRGWSPRRALGHLGASLAGFDAPEERRQRLRRPVMVLELMAARFGADALAGLPHDRAEARRQRVDAAAAAARLTRRGSAECDAAALRSGTACPGHWHRTGAACGSARPHSRW